MTRLLLIEDSADMALGLKNNLEIEGYEVEWANDGPTGLAAACSGAIDLVVLDLMLPGLDGITVLRRIRELGDRPPVVILTARGQEEDKVRGLRLGADDYVTKPFGVLELLARIEAVLRRMHPQAAAGPIVRFAGIVVDHGARTVRRGAAEIPLTPKEFDLLRALLEANGAAVSRADLMERVWGYHADVLSRTVDTHVAELRRKLESAPNAKRLIFTARKVGYRLRRDESV
jgi:DNA-binding response OmpR family regulator